MQLTSIASDEYCGLESSLRNLQNRRCEVTSFAVITLTDYPQTNTLSMQQFGTLPECLEFLEKLRNINQVAHNWYLVHWIFLLNDFSSPPSLRLHRPPMC